MARSAATPLIPALALAALHCRTSQPARLLPPAPLAVTRRQELCPRLALPQSTDGAIYDSASVDSLPVLIAYGPYRPPMGWRPRSGSAVEVPLSFVVTATGDVALGSVLGPTPDGEAAAAFINAALVAAGANVFCPALRRGLRVPMRVRIAHKITRVFE